MKHEDRIRNILNTLYGIRGEGIIQALLRKLDQFHARNPGLQHELFDLTQKDVVVITYGDQFQDDNLPPLDSLSAFLDSYLSGLVSIIHVLPFFPSSSDDGFSVSEYRKVDPRLGSWGEIGRLASRYKLMVDLVVNHVSQESVWFKAFLRGEEPYKDFFITIDPAVDLSNVFRPRSHPLLTPYETASGKKHVWTTFSADQVDLNFSNPAVLLELIDVLLFYVEKGARLVRLDAIGYVWKEPGTSCLNLPQAHLIVKLFRAVLDEVAPAVKLITETNVPHIENIAYFGDPLEPGVEKGDLMGDEAQLVYNFSLAPLVVHAFQNGDARTLSRWAETLSAPYPSTTFLNFIASHDGIGVTPARGLLSDREIQELITRTLEHGGQVSYKKNPDGSESAYELNITLFDALNKPQEADHETSISRFLAAQSCMLSLAGVPGIYVHSLFGSRNCSPCFAATRQPRSLNREKFKLEELIRDLQNEHAPSTRIFDATRRFLEIRGKQPAFHPAAAQTVLFLDPRIFAILRSGLDPRDTILCLINTSAEQVPVSVHLAGLELAPSGFWKDLILGGTYQGDSGYLVLTLEGYQTLWLKQTA